MAKLIRQRRKVPIKAVVGKPGKFFDPKSKKLYDISQAYEGDKYDSVYVPLGAQTPGTQYLFFQNLQNKTRIDTNFKTQNRLDPNERMVLERMGIYVHTAMGSVLALSGDIRQVMENGYVKVTVNDDNLWEGVASWLPTGYGLYGQSMEAASTFATVGVPSTAGAARLRRKQMLTTEHSLGGELSFLARLGWIAGYANPTTVGPIVAKLVFHGPISRPATR